MILVADVIVRSVMAFPLNRRMYSSNFDVNMISNESMLCSFAFTWSQYWQLSFTCIFKSNIILPCIHVQMLCTMLLFLLDLKENCEPVYWTGAKDFFLSLFYSIQPFVFPSFILAVLVPCFPLHTNIPTILSIAPRQLLIDCKHNFIAKWLQLY